MVRGSLKLRLAVESDVLRLLPLDQDALSGNLPHLEVLNHCCEALEFISICPRLPGFDASLHRILAKDQTHGAGTSTFHGFVPR